MEIPHVSLAELLPGQKSVELPPHVRIVLTALAGSLDVGAAVVVGGGEFSSLLVSFPGRHEAAGIGSFRVLLEGENVELVRRRVSGEELRRYRSRPQMASPGRSK